MFTISRTKYYEIYRRSRIEKNVGRKLTDEEYVAVKNTPLMLYDNRNPTNNVPISKDLLYPNYILPNYYITPPLKLNRTIISLDAGNQVDVSYEPDSFTWTRIDRFTTIRRKTLTSEYNIPPGTYNAIFEMNYIISMRISNIVVIKNKYMNLEAGLITVLIRELSEQSFIASGINKFHFIAKPQISSNTISNNMITLQFDNYNNVFHFNNPISVSNLDTLTLEFYAKNEKIKFDASYIRCKLVRVGTHIEFESTIDHSMVLYEFYQAIVKPVTKSLAELLIDIIPDDPEHKTDRDKISEINKVTTDNFYITVYGSILSGWVGFSDDYIINEDIYFDIYISSSRPIIELEFVGF